jgi:hypothetical protein
MSQQDCRAWHLFHGKRQSGCYLYGTLVTLRMDVSTRASMGSFAGLLAWP